MQGNKEKEPRTDEVQRVQENTNKSRWGKIFRTRPDCPGTHPASYAMVSGLFPGGKAAGAWR